MTDRRTADTITDDVLDQLYADREQLAARVCREAEDLAAAQQRRDELAAAVERVTATVTALEAQAADFNAHHNPACECEWGEALAEAASRVRAALDGTPGTVLTTDRVLTAEEYEEIKTRWNQEHGGGRQNHAGPITTGPPAEERPCLCPETGLVNEHMQGCPYEKPQEN